MLHTSFNSLFIWILLTVVSLFDSLLLTVKNILSLDHLTYMFTGHREGVGQVHSISVYLQKGEDVTTLHCIVQAAQFGSRISTSALSKALLYVFSCDEIFAALPERLRKQFNNQLCILCCFIYRSRTWFHSSIKAWLMSYKNRNREKSLIETCDSHVTRGIGFGYFFSW